MIITQTPFRMSFFGGGTDFYDYYSVYGGQVLSTAIDKYCYVTLRHLPPFFEFENYATYSVVERFNTPREVRHPLIRAALQYIPTERVHQTSRADISADVIADISGTMKSAKVRNRNFRNAAIPVIIPAPIRQLK